MDQQIDLDWQITQLNQMRELQAGIQDLMLLIGVERFAQISNQMLGDLLSAYQLQYVVLYKLLSELSQEPKEVKEPKKTMFDPLYFMDLFIGHSLN